VTLIILNETGGNAQAQHEDAAGHWIQCAGVADAALSTQATDALHDVMTGGESW
jgi:hypothetical protein